MTINCTKVNIKLNSKGDDVKELQKYLKYLGYYTDKIDGICGKYTVEAIKKLQKQYNVTVDGVFGKQTCQACTINGVDVSKSNLTLDNGTWKNIMKRFDLFVKENGREPNLLYLDKENPYQSITLAKYKEILQRYNTYVSENQREPNFMYINKPTNTSTTNNNTNNNTKTTTTTTTNNTNNTTITKYISSPHWVATGCNKLGQCTGYYCMPHSIRQNLCKFGIDDYKESTLAGWCGTTTAGTGHSGGNTAIKQVANKKGLNLKTTWVNFSSLGNNINTRFQALGELISQKNIAVITHVLYRGQWGHYEVIKSIDTKNKTLEILNSLGTKNSNGTYQGYIETRSYNTEANYLANTPYNQPSICIIEKQ